MEITARANAAAEMGEQYSLGRILGIWALAAIPMGILGWVIFPALSPDFNSDPLGAGVTRMVLLTVGLIWQFVLSMIIVRREEGDLRWATIKRRLRLNTPRDPTTGETGRRLWLWVVPFMIALAAQVTTLPLTLYYFQRLSLTGLIANFIILPAQPALMVTGGLALLLGLVWAPLGQLAAWADWPFSAYTLGFVRAFARLPGASFYLGEVAPALVALYYAALFGLTWLLSRPPPQRPAWSLAAGRQAATGGLLVLAAGLAEVSVSDVNSRSCADSTCGTQRADVSIFVAVGTKPVSKSGRSRW